MILLRLRLYTILTILHFPSLIPFSLLHFIISSHSPSLPSLSFTYSFLPSFLLLPIIAFPLFPSFHFPFFSIFPFSSILPLLSSASSPSLSFTHSSLSSFYHASLFHYFLSPSLIPFSLPAFHPYSLLRSLLLSYPPPALLPRRSGSARSKKV